MNKTLSILICLLPFFLHSCNTSGERGESYTYGDAKVLADESLFPVVDDEAVVFNSRYKRAHIDMVYKPQQEVLNMLLNDSASIAVLPRMLTEEEASTFEKKKVRVRPIKFATDGIGIITSNDNPLQNITLQELKDFLSGKADHSPVIVFDNVKSSTVEYLMDHFDVKELTAKNIYALNTSEEVIRYIKNNKNAVGIISVSWIKRPTKEIEEDVKGIKFVAVKNNVGNYVLPTQSSLKTKEYPLTRDLYLIDCQGKAGLGTGFAAFLASDIGQRVILKSGLAPDSLPSRQIIIKK
ncbi:PstS family phosphate ABC transporter substrate-binding protein [Pseudopedobacter beijingensis]|uniref:PstS family phosphate ABC transporter substrate-binding protein n=1 Tax=Pseudopedobacter beijingensis TaxID=1207056 RepID=A0ABW4IC21_9SPHI